MMDDLANDIGKLEGVKAVALATPNRTADLGIVQVIPERSQTDPATAALVREDPQRWRRRWSRSTTSPSCASPARPP